MEPGISARLGTEGVMHRVARKQIWPRMNADDADFGSELRSLFSERDAFAWLSQICRSYWPRPFGPQRELTFRRICFPTNEGFQSQRAKIVRGRNDFRGSHLRR